MHTIAKEEREGWRAWSKRIQAPHSASDVKCEAAFIVRLLDALEAAEEHIESLLPERELLVRANTAEMKAQQLMVSRNEMQLRAAEMERQRDRLADKLADVYSSENIYTPDGACSPETWIAHAAQPDNA